MFLFINPFVLSAISPGTSIIQSIQSFSINITTSSNTVTITSVDAANSIIIWNGFSTTTGNGNDSDFRRKYPQLVLTNATTVTASLNGGGNGDTITVKGYVVEFKSDAVQSVQSGVINFIGTATSATASVSTVTVAKSAVIFAGGTTADINTGTERLSLSTLEITDSTTITATREFGATNATVSYFLLELKSAYVNSRNQEEITVSGSPTDATITAVDLNKTILFNAGWRKTDTDLRNRPASLLLNSTTVRGVHGGIDAGTAACQVLELTQGLTTVQSGSITIGTASTSNTATITSVDTSKSFIVLSGIVCDSDSESYHYSWGHVVLTNATTVTVTRGSTGDSSSITIYFMVVETV